MTAKNTICIWYDGDAAEAANFYARTFPHSAVGTIFHAPGDYPAGKLGDVLTVEFTVAGIACLGLNPARAFCRLNRSMFNAGYVALKLKKSGHLCLPPELV